MRTQFNCQKHFYFKLFSLFKQLYITIQFTVSTVSMSKTVQFQTILFSISTQFKCKYGIIVKTFLFLAIQFNQTTKFSISMPLVLFNPYIGPGQVLPRRARVDLGAMAMKKCYVFLKTQHYWNLTPDCLVSYPGYWLGGGLTPLLKCSRCTLQPQPTEQ